MSLVEQCSSAGVSLYNVNKRTASSPTSGCETNSSTESNLKKVERILKRKWGSDREGWVGGGTIYTGRVCRALLDQISP